MRRRAGALLLALALPFASLDAQASLGRIRGVIHDSLTGRPLEGAVVFVAGSSRMATTGENGRFTLDSVPAGRRALTFSSPALDSLGLFTLGREVDVAPERDAELALGTPSFATLWRTLCPAARASRDSGIVYGSVANAANDTRLAGARVVFSWWDISKQDRNVVVDRPVLVARTDSVGNYYACGLPSDMNLMVEVDADPLSSGNMETTLPAIRVSRRDLYVSAEMHVSDSVRRAAGAVLDDALGVRRRGTATLRGVVHDAKGAVAAGVLITLPSADTTARTDSLGRFVLAGLPGGTQLLRARKLGNGPLTETVTLRPGRTTEVALVLPAANVLATVNVRADRTNRLLSGFDERRTKGAWGYYLGERDLKFRLDMASALSGLPGLRVSRIRGQVVLYMERGMNSCVPRVFLDGRPSMVEEISMLQMEELYGVEIYRNPEAVPAQFQTGPVDRCGAVLIWTKDAR